MWTATLEKAYKANGLFILVIHYSDGTETVKRVYKLERVSKSLIKRMAINEVAKLEAMKTEVIDLPVGQSLDITPDPVVTPPTPTAAEIAFNAWHNDYDRLQKLTNLAGMGLIAGDDSRITTLQTTLIAGWKNAYLDNI